MDDLTAAALAELSFPTREHAEAWHAHLLDVRQTYPPETDWETFASALTQRSTDLGLAEDRVGAFLDQLTSTGDPAATIETVCAEPEQVTALVPEDTAAAYDEDAWFAFLAEEGARWDGFAESWPTFREWFVYTAVERGFGPPAQQLVSYVEAAPSPWQAMAEYGVQVNPLAEFPLVAELAACESDDDLRRLLTERTGVDFTAVEA
jgi:hypothetical protein